HADHPADAHAIFVATVDVFEHRVGHVQAHGTDEEHDEESQILLVANAGNHEHVEDEELGDVLDDVRAEGERGKRTNGPGDGEGEQIEENGEVHAVQWY